MSRIFTLLLLGCIISKILLLPAGGYWVSEQGDYVVVESAEGELLQETDTRVFLLPPADKEQLRRKFFCRNKRDLAALLENLCS